MWALNLVERYVWGFCLASGSLALSQTPQSVYIWMLYGIRALSTEQIWSIRLYMASAKLPLPNWKFPDLSALISLAEEHFSG